MSERGREGGRNRVEGAGDRGSGSGAARANRKTGNRKSMHTAPTSG